MSFFLKKNGNMNIYILLEMTKFCSMNNITSVFKNTFLFSITKKKNTFGNKKKKVLYFLFLRTKNNIKTHKNIFDN